MTALRRRGPGTQHDARRMVPLTGVRAGRRIDALVRVDRAERLVVRRVLEELTALPAEIDGGVRETGPTAVPPRA